MDHQNWNEVWTKYQAFNFKKLNDIYERIGLNTLPRESRVLDLGCGTGEFVRILKDKGFSSVQGMEPQADLVRKAAMNCIQVGNCLDVPSPQAEASYDAVIMLGVLHHLSSMEEVKIALKNVMKLLRPEGLFFSVEPRRTMARSVTTRLIFAVPMNLLPARVKMDRILVEEEKVELNRWLSYERFLPRVTQALGFKTCKLDHDWKSAYQVLRKPGID